MKTQEKFGKSGFTLLETVIAIGVLAVLLTGFLAVFGPAASGIRRSINAQEADRLATSLERELVLLREEESTTTIKTGFEKAFEWIEKSATPQEAVFVYQYRGDPNRQRRDQTPEPMAQATGSPGRDYTVQAMARRLSDPMFFEDLPAIEGGLFMVKCTQLVFDQRGEFVMDRSNAGRISDPASRSRIYSPTQYPDAVIAFAAEFHAMPTTAVSYFRGEAFKRRFESTTTPVFVRNLAVRR